MFWYLADLCPDSMSIKVCSHIYTFEFAYENINIFSQMTISGIIEILTVISLNPT